MSDCSLICLLPHAFTWLSRLRCRSQVMRDMWQHFSRPKILYLHIGSSLCSHSIFTALVILYSCPGGDAGVQDVGLGPAADGAAPVRGHARRQHLPAVAPGQSAQEAAPAAQPAGRYPCLSSHVTHLGACQKEDSPSGADIFPLSRLANLRRKLPLPHNLQVGTHVYLLMSRIWALVRRKVRHLGPTSSRCRAGPTCARSCPCRTTCRCAAVLWVYFFFLSNHLNTSWVNSTSACAVGAESQLQPAAPGRGVPKAGAPAQAEAQNAPQQHCWHRRQASTRRCRLLPVSYLLFMQSRMQAHHSLALWPVLWASA